MNLEELIVSSIRDSAAQVFSTMLGVEIDRGEVSVETGTPEQANDGIVSFIGVAGAWAGTGSLSCSPALACRICSHMLMMDASSVDEEVLDTVAELTNMIIGNVKTELEQYLGPLGLSIPTVIFGRNFRTKSVGNNKWTVVCFQWKDEHLLVKLCLSPTDRVAHGAGHVVGQSCALDVRTES
ncbi:MAG TPA: chemotaxis protein CheX [Bryobacteraceae bacterium]|nr:chemotaxis protein CheX [Bryobacteraceae bacterium]